MRRRIAITVLAGVAAATIQLGCMNIGSRHKNVTMPPADGAKNSAERELPPHESATACLATAKELDKANHYEPAIQLFEKARQNDPKLSAQVSRRLAVLYDRKGDFTKAMEEYGKALKQSPKDADLLNNIGYSYYCRGQFDEAESHYRKALAIAPHNTRVWNNLGLVMGITNKHEDSLTAFEKAVSPAQARCNLAFLLAAQGKVDDAKVYYRKALELDPSLKLAQDALAKLSLPPTPKGQNAPPAGLTPVGFQSPSTAPAKSK